MAELYEDLTYFNASIARFKALPAEKRAQWDYASWSPETIRAGLAYLTRALKSNTGATVRFYQGATEDGSLEPWMAAVAPNGNVLGAFNDGWLCPPIC